MRAQVTFWKDCHVDGEAEGTGVSEGLQQGGRPDRGGPPLLRVCNRGCDASSGGDSVPSGRFASLNVLPNCEIQDPGVVPGGLGMGHLLKIPNPNPVVPRTLQRSPTSPCRFQIAFGKKHLLKPVTEAMKLGSEAWKQATGKPGLRRPWGHISLCAAVSFWGQLHWGQQGLRCVTKSLLRVTQKSGNPTAQAWVHAFATTHRS